MRKEGADEGGAGGSAEGVAGGVVGIVGAAPGLAGEVSEKGTTEALLTRAFTSGEDGAEPPVVIRPTSPEKEKPAATPASTATAVFFGDDDAELLVPLFKFASRVCCVPCWVPPNVTCVLCDACVL